MTQKPFTVMAKPVGSRCNMRCSYCYYLGKNRYLEKPDQDVMKNALLETFIRRYIEESTGPAVQFTWHGGEPTLAGLDFYRRAVKIQKKYLPRSWTVWNNLQTNGLILNDAWCDFIAENKFDVGLSLDGDALAHDAIRKDVNGDGTYARVYENAKRLIARGVKPDLLATVSSASAKRPLEVYRALRSIGSGWIQFIPIVVRRPDGSMAQESVTPEEYGAFLKAVFDEWVKHDLGKTDVQLFAEMAGVLAGREANLCWMAPECGRAVVVEEDGSVYSCDHFVSPEYKLGNIRQNGLRDLVDSPRQAEFGARKRTALTRECRECPALPLCGGGCPKDRFAISVDGEEGQYYLCPGLKAFFAHAVPILKEVMRLSRLGNRPDEIMKKIAL